MNKKQLSERDICTKFITPPLDQAGLKVSQLIAKRIAPFQRTGEAP